jgi:hypothetical protein
VQAINDFILFTVAGGGSLISGVVYSHFSWAILIYMSSVLVTSPLPIFVTSSVDGFESVPVWDHLADEVLVQFGRRVPTDKKSSRRS